MNKKFLGLIVASMFLTIMALLVVVSKDAETAQGSVSVSNEYLATTTDSGWSIATTQCKDTLTGHKTLGSVVVAFASNANIDIYDATTTGPHSLHATTTIASFPSVVAGTYTYDVGVQRGVCVVVTNAAAEGIASTTITTRP